ncbi:hypothetical protein ABG768_024643 [Culter alburnus]|uniref:Uncharacterized protein n=1 Tax=Culter alburnus TaxID=194366 RepID=A0AAW2AFC0_CULAL
MAIEDHTKKNIRGKRCLTGGPGRVRQPFTFDREPSDEDVEAAIAVLRHSADEKSVREKMKMIEQDFRFLFGEATANKFLEK